MDEDYQDWEGNPCSLVRLVRDEPEWAANRIRVGRRDAEALTAAIARAEAAERELADADEDMHALCDQLAEANGESVVSGPADGIARLAAQRDALAADNARLREVMRGDTETAGIRAAVIGHLARGRCECDHETGAVPCVACAMVTVMEWARGIDAALAQPGSEDAENG